MARFSAIDATGQLVHSPGVPVPITVQNVGTVPLAIYYSIDGSGDPQVILAAGTANDDGTGGLFEDEDRSGPVWIKAPTGTGRALVAVYR